MIFVSPLNVEPNKSLVGSIAVQEKTVFLRWLEVYGADKIILGADARDEKIATSGWLETSDLELLPFLKDYVARGIQQIICTDISKDGMLEGPSVVLYQKKYEQHSPI